MVVRNMAMNYQSVKKITHKKTNKSAKNPEPSRNRAFLLAFHRISSPPLHHSPNFHVSQLWYHDEDHHLFSPLMYYIWSKNLPNSEDPLRRNSDPKGLSGCHGNSATGTRKDQSESMESSWVLLVRRRSLCDKHLLQHHQQLEMRSNTRSGDTSGSPLRANQRRNTTCYGSVAEQGHEVG